MFNYKRLTFIFLFTTLFFLSTDTLMERQLRKNLLSLFDIVVEEGSQVSDSAPRSFIDTIEDTRIATYNFLNHSGNQLTEKAAENKGILSLLLNIFAYLILLFKFIANYVITFYPFIIFLLYFFFTSRFFRKDDFGYNNF